jgi:N-acetylglucosaminyldiphosphoundecaprenol N-acetyl-beta-D-mannosaminyltransferase
MGLEWAFRLCNERKRLWKRYLVEPWPLAFEVARVIVAGKGADDQP